MSTEVATAPDETPITIRGIRGEDITGFAILSFAMILFVAWPRRASFDSPRPRPRRTPRQGHPYRSAAARPPKDRTWIWRTPPRG